MKSNTLTIIACIVAVIAMISSFRKGNQLEELETKHQNTKEALVKIKDNYSVLLKQNNNLISEKNKPNKNIQAINEMKERSRKFIEHFNLNITQEVTIDQEIDFEATIKDVNDDFDWYCEFGRNAPNYMQSENYLFIYGIDFGRGVNSYKLKLLMYEALAYQDLSYISKYEEELREYADYVKDFRGQ